MFANGASTAAFMWAVRAGIGGIKHHDVNKDGNLGPERFTPEQQEAYKKQLNEALATQPKDGFKDEFEALKWFKENIVPIANQGDVPRMDFEVSTDLAPTMSGRWKFFGIKTKLSNWITQGGTLHTHQTNNPFSPGDRANHQNYRTGNEWLVNDSDFYKFKGVDYYKAKDAWVSGGKVGPEPSNRDYYFIYNDKQNNWVEYRY